MEIFKVFKKSIALTCVAEGCNLVYTEPNWKKPYLRVFCFEDNELLRRTLTRINSEK